jgi:hypothetical protein
LLLSLFHLFLADLFEDLQHTVLFLGLKDIFKAEHKMP